MSWFDTIFADNNVSNHAKTLYMYLKHRGNAEGKSFPSVPTMARELHLSQSSIRRAITAKADRSAKGTVCLCLTPFPCQMDRGMSSPRLKEPLIPEK